VPRGWQLHSSTRASKTRHAYADSCRVDSSNNHGRSSQTASLGTAPSSLTRWHESAQGRKSMADRCTQRQSQTTGTKSFLRKAQSLQTPALALKHSVCLIGVSDDHTIPTCLVNFTRIHGTFGATRKSRLWRRDLDPSDRYSSDRIHELIRRSVVPLQSEPSPPSQGMRCRLNHGCHLCCVCGEFRLREHLAPLLTARFGLVAEQ